MLRPVLPPAPDIALTELVVQIAILFAEELEDVRAPVVDVVALLRPGNLHAEVDALLDAGRPGLLGAGARQQLVQEPPRAEVEVLRLQREAVLPAGRLDHRVHDAVPPEGRVTLALAFVLALAF